MRYIQHPQTHKLIPANEYYADSRSLSWQVMPDIQPYISQIDGHIVQSRRAHRIHLRNNNCIEVGNEKPVEKKIEPPPGRKQVIIDLVNERLRYT